MPTAPLRETKESEMVAKFKSQAYLPMAYTTETIGPKEALGLLKGNEHNRPVNDLTVSRYAKDMKAGQWKMTYEPIAIAADGRLLNGQHRLYAVIESGAVVRFTICRNADPDTFDVVDIGRRRTGGDHFAIAFPDCENPGRAAAVTKAAIARMRSGGRSSRTSDYSIEALGVYADHRILIDSLIAAFGTKARAAVVGCAINCVLDDFATLAQVVVVGNRFRDKDWQGIGDPLSVLNERLLANPNMDGGDCYAISLTAISAALAGRKLKVLRPAGLDWDKTEG